MGNASSGGSNSQGAGGSGSGSGRVEGAATRAAQAAQSARAFVASNPRFSARSLSAVAGSTADGGADSDAGGSSAGASALAQAHAAADAAAALEAGANGGGQITDVEEEEDEDEDAVAARVPESAAALRHRSASFPATAPTSNGRMSSAAKSSGAGAGASSSGGAVGASASGASSPKNASCWCLVKAKTRQHSSNRVARKIQWFEAKAGNEFTVGRAQGCDLRLDDDRCAALNAVLEPTMRGDVPGVMLNPKARMYQLVGMGAKKNLEDTVIYVGAVIKVGSVSLEVTDMCTNESDDFVERFAVEINTAGADGRGSVRRMRNRGSSSRKKADGHASSSTASAAATGKVEKAGGGSASGSGSSNHEGESDGSVDGGAASIVEDVPNAGEDVRPTIVHSQVGEAGIESDEDIHSNDEDDEEEDDAMCYICWGGPDLTDPGEEGGSIEASLDGASDVDATGAAVAKNLAAAHADKLRKRANPLIQNPCGKCSGSSSYVHLNCLLTWIKSSGSGHCSICNGPLPQHFSSPPPNLELKVVRHRRGQSWVGTRRFRLSFADRDHAIIGRDSEADVRLSDRSVGSTHARITFNRETREFELADCSSLGGTFLQVKEPIDLLPETSTYLKIGRTLLSLRMTQKRGALYTMLQNPLTSFRR